MKFIIIDGVFLCSFTMCDAKVENVTHKTIDDKAVPEKNKSIIKSVFTKLINKRNVVAIDEFYDQKMVGHNAWVGQVPGLVRFRKVVKEFIKKFPDLQITVDSIKAAKGA